jgi:hypothetical protein
MRLQQVYLGRNHPTAKPGQWRKFGPSVFNIASSVVIRPFYSSETRGCHPPLQADPSKAPGLAVVNQRHNWIKARHSLQRDLVTQKEVRQSAKAWHEALATQDVKKTQS